MTGYQYECGEVTLGQACRLLQGHSGRHYPPTVEDEILALVQPILNRTKDQVRTHSGRCYEYHVECLAAAVAGIIHASSSKDTP